MPSTESGNTPADRNTEAEKPRILGEKGQEGRPSIAEALCELYLQPISTPNSEPSDLAASWEPRWFGKMLQKLGSSYDLEPIQVNMMRIRSEPGRKPEIAEVLGPGDRMIYKHEDGTHLLQLAPGILSVNEVGPYPGWEQFAKHIEKGWKTLREIAPNFEVCRIGLRYINRIPRTTGSSSVGHWLSNENWLPPRLLNQTDEFFFKIDIKTNDFLCSL